MKFIFTLSGVLASVLLAGCVSNSVNYARTDGGAINMAQEQATLAQCKGEGLTAEAIPPASMVDWREQ